MKRRKVNLICRLIGHISSGMPFARPYCIRCKTRL